MIAIAWTRKPRVFTGLDGLAAVGWFAAAGAIAHPRWELLRTLTPPCVFLRLTGLPCGSCGLTRAFVRAIHADLLGALAASPLGTLLFYTWLALAFWLAAGWVSPPLRVVPELRPTNALGRLALRFGLPLAFLFNWGYLIGSHSIADSPSE